MHVVHVFGTHPDALAYFAYVVPLKGQPSIVRLNPISDAVSPQFLIGMYNPPLLSRSPQANGTLLNRPFMSIMRLSSLATNHIQRLQYET